MKVTRFCTPTDSRYWIRQIEAAESLEQLDALDRDFRDLGLCGHNANSVLTAVDAAFKRLEKKETLPHDTLTNIAFRSWLNWIDSCDRVGALDVIERQFRLIRDRVTPEQIKVFESHLYKRLERLDSGRTRGM